WSSDVCSSDLGTVTSRPPPNPNAAYSSWWGVLVVPVVPVDSAELEPSMEVVSSSGDATMSSNASACMHQRPRAASMVTVMVSPWASSVVTRVRRIATATVTSAYAEQAAVVLQLLPPVSVTDEIVGCPPGLGESHAMASRIVAPAGTAWSSASVTSSADDDWIAVPTTPRCATGQSRLAVTAMFRSDQSVTAAASPGSRV